MIKTLSVMAMCLASALALPASAQELAFVIRHAEKEATGEDPPLTEAGRGRAKSWAELLGRSGIDIVIHTNAARSRETATIISRLLDLERVEVPISDTAGLMDLLAFDYADGTVLLVGHTETIPSILFQMGIPEPPEIDDGDFANLFMVVPTGEDRPVFVELRMP